MFNINTSTLKRPHTQTLPQASKEIGPTLLLSYEIELFPYQIRTKADMKMEEIKKFKFTSMWGHLKTERTILIVNSTLVFHVNTIERTSLSSNTIARNLKRSDRNFNCDLYSISNPPYEELWLMFC